ncbi:hypothetical protein E0H51_34065 [Rhizobium leguminosarum bv. viciae]|uniref:hypothetical protein n=1 Tax=Rhizobium leguminosarum TaxID=384 RepID=UPI0010402BAA|nr:hypothetical protein [Rhizobium leguminosarum]TBY66238.1 hypothetical protein E0H51_34065 [Rhizobium leguminosarum bv. viciae]
MRRIQRISPTKLPDETICLSVSAPYWNSKALVGFPSPYMLVVRYFERHDPDSGKWFFAMKFEGRYLIFMKRLPNISDFYSAFPGRSTEVKTFHIRGRVFRGYDLRYELTSYVKLCRKLGIEEIERARSLIGLNSDTSIDRTIPIYYEQREGRAKIHLYADIIGGKHRKTIPPKLPESERQKPWISDPFADIVTLIRLRYKSLYRLPIRLSADNLIGT